MKPLDLEQPNSDEEMIDEAEQDGQEVFKWSRLTDVVLVDECNIELFVFPSENKRQEYLA